MRRRIRTLAAVLACLALVAALPAPCACAPERSASKHAEDHACCAPPLGVRAADAGCCDETPDLAQALPCSAAPAAAPLAAVTQPVAVPSVLCALARLAVPVAPSPPPTVLRI